MTSYNIIQLFYTWGWKISPLEYKNFLNYFEKMLKKDRVIIIRDDVAVRAVVFYFLTNDYNSIYKKYNWDVPEDDPLGSQIYIDKMVAQFCNRRILKYLQEAIETKFPNVEVGVYHREPFDKCVKIYRKGVAHELQNTISK